MADLEGYYINETDLKAYMPAAELDKVTEFLTGSAGETNVQRVIKNVCGWIDTKLQKKYDLPLKESYNLSALKAAASKKVVWDLSNNYSSISEETRKVRQTMNDEANLYIEDLASGKDELIDSAATPLPETDKYYFEANTVRIPRDMH